MKKCILQYLEQTAKQHANKIAFGDGNRQVSYAEFLENSKKLGSNLINLEQMNRPIAIMLDKSVSCLEAMMGVLYSGNFYTVLDIKSPIERLSTIVETLNPIAIITDSKNLTKAEEIAKRKTENVISENSTENIEKNTSANKNNDIEILIYDEIIQTKINEEKLVEVRGKMIDTDPMYILFTSGSTGVPKGTVITHKAVIAYAHWAKETFMIDQNTIWGSQTPFYFSMSITDIFTTILSGATFYIVPKMYFSFPVKLLQYLNEKKINTIYWVPSALCIVANLKALDEVELPYLKKILFAGEVMPTKQLNIWIEHLPNALFANLFGPTETTDICTYYIIDRKFENTESIPIGKHCDNCNVMIIKEDGTEAKKGEEGELCARGSFLAQGYYNNPIQTHKVFVQNPLNQAYPEIIYKTGDIVKENDRGELIYLSRKDFQIKHMGYRIELGEIETAINSIDNIIACACVYDEKTDKIVLFYQGEKLEEKDLLDQASQRLPKYMCPNEIHCIERMPHNANGKIDRKLLKTMI